jgi:hypothetical protein
MQPAPHHLPFRHRHPSNGNLVGGRDFSTGPKHESLQNHGRVPSSRAGWPCGPAKREGGMGEAHALLLAAPQVPPAAQAIWGELEDSAGVGTAVVAGGGF